MRAASIPERGRSGAAARFTVDRLAEPARGAMADAAAPVVAAGMLALQEAAGETVEERAARRHGRALLAALTRLQHQLLGATDADSALDELALLAAEMPRVADPALAAALNAVALRVKVELARRGR